MATAAFDAVPEVLRDALQNQGFQQLTEIQTSVLSAPQDKDLRIRSQTGSGKTVAFGLTIGRSLLSLTNREPGVFALICVPTRELAAQVQRELSWLLRACNAKVCAVYGGTSVRNDERMLKNPIDVVVGTPGRLRDLINRNALSLAKVQVVILDEADQMLDMGFQEELTEILSQVPAERQTHLVSATFPDYVMRLADGVQKEVHWVHGSSAPTNQDIDHIILPYSRGEREDALINLLLMGPDESTLVFVKTRDGAAELVRHLREEGIFALLLSGDVEQSERTRTLEMFRSGVHRVLVATDVAARGIDVVGISRVIHADAPEDPESYTHRSGRTGRAGRKGTSYVLVSANWVDRVQRLLRRAKIKPSIGQVPQPEQVLEQHDKRCVELMLAPDAESVDEQIQKLAKTLLEQVDAQTLVHRLLSRSLPSLPTSPRPITSQSTGKPAKTAEKKRHKTSFEEFDDNGFVKLHVTWGSRRGADPRKLLALSCRRGDVTKDAIGVIWVGLHESTVEVKTDLAEGFLENAAQPDARDSGVQFSLASTQPSLQRKGGESKGFPKAKTKAAPERAQYTKKAPPKRVPGSAKRKRLATR